MESAIHQRNIRLAILAAALGYFVDVYDIILFTAVRVPSLQAFGVSGDQLAMVGLRLMNIQLLGMVVGGFVWGVLADKRGRISVLFLSIILYSVANLLNAFVINVPTYAFLRFVAGVGLAGELGAGITLVNELMSKEKRGYGSMLVATCGVLGGIAGGLVGEIVPWRIAYFIGGILGFGLLLLRWSLSESTLFMTTKQQDIKRGDIFFFLRSPSLLRRYGQCLLLGSPIWIFIGIFITLSPEVGKALHIQDGISAGRSILFFNVGFSLGNVGSSFLSQTLRSRKKSAFLFLCITMLAMWTYLLADGVSSQVFYLLCVFLGFGAGYWALFLLMSSEQFGTNLRATLTTSLPNMVRGLVLPVSAAFQLLRPETGELGALKIIGTISVLLALTSLFFLKETYAVSMDFIEN